MFSMCLRHVKRVAVSYHANFLKFMLHLNLVFSAFIGDNQLSIKSRFLATIFVISYFVIVYCTLGFRLF